MEFAKPRQVIPMHFGTYPILKGNPEEFRAALAKRHLDDRMLVMKPGEDRSF